MKEITVIIVTYNSEFHIYDCLSSLFMNNDIGDKLEVIVVDNCSKNYQTMKARINAIYEKRVIVVSNTRNGGYGQGNNVGIRLATSPVILIMNPDVRLEMPIMSRAVKAFRSNVDMAMLGMTQLNEKKRKHLSFDCTSMIHPFIGIPVSIICNRIGLYLPRIMYFSGACFFVRKDIFMKAGLYDEDIFMYSEEDDIHNRIKTIPNAKFIYERRMAYLHLHSAGKEKQTTTTSYAHYLERFKSQITWKGKIGIKPSESIKQSLRWVRFFIITNQIPSLFSANARRKKEYYIGLYKIVCCKYQEVLNKN